MANILISLVSDQIIPNIRLIKELKSQIDNYIFISTTEMEKQHKTTYLLKSCNIKDRKSKTIIVSPFNFKEIEDNLQKLNLNQDNHYSINITGGTKPMSIVVMSYFSNFKNIKIFYVPIGKDFYRQILPRLENPENIFSKNISLKEYLTANSFELISFENKITKNNIIAENLLKEIIENKGEINTIYKIKNAHSLQSSSDKVYYSGRWFEEFIFLKIKDYFNLNENQIAYNVELEVSDSKNEYDVVFIQNEFINIVECKAYFEVKNLRTKIEKDLYKLGALDDDFGLRVNAIYITTIDIEKNNPKEYESLIKRAKSLNVKLFQLTDLINDNFLENL